VNFHPGEYFINILCATFSYRSTFRSFFYLQFGLVLFWQKNIGTKAAHKMLIKFTTSVIFTSFYEQLLRTKMLCSAFLNHMNFFLRKNIGAKAS